MKEIEKLYKNAGVRPYIYCSKPRLDCDARETGNCKQDCEYYSGKKLLISFTAEKQIGLIKWLSEQYTITTRYMTSAWFITAETSDVTRTVIKYTVMANTFEETIASAINCIWSRQDLTEEEKEQIKEILNE